MIIRLPTNLSTNTPAVSDPVTSPQSVDASALAFPTTETEGAGPSALGSMDVDETAPPVLRRSPPRCHHERSVARSEREHLMGQQAYHQDLQHVRAGHCMSPICRSRSPRRPSRPISPPPLIDRCLIGRPPLL